MSIGLEMFLDGSISMGAPIDIWRALAPTILALSKRVSLGGPTRTFFSELVSLELPYSFLSSTFGGWRRPRLARRDYVIDPGAFRGLFRPYSI